MRPSSTGRSSRSRSRSSTCSRTSSRTPVARFAVRSCSRRSGATRSVTPRRSRCTSAGCARRSKSTLRTRAPLHGARRRIPVDVVNTFTRAAILIACGAVVAGLLALASGTSVSDAAILVALAAGGGARGRGRPVRRCCGRCGRARCGSRCWRSPVATTLTMVAGVLLAAEFMLVSDHDLAVLAVVLVVAGSVAGGAALYLGDMYERDTREVGDLAERLIDPYGSERVGARSRSSPPICNGSPTSSPMCRRAWRHRGTRERALDASRRELVAWVSHDLRSPIASIRALAEALDEGVVSDPDDVARYHLAIVHESHRLGALVDDLFELSRLASGAEPVDQPFVPVERAGLRGARRDHARGGDRRRGRVGVRRRPPVGARAGERCPPGLAQPARQRGAAHAVRGPSRRWR